jgi:hypothetical protein
MYLTLLLRTLGQMSKKSTILRKIVRLVTIIILLYGGNNGNNCGL